MKKISFASGVLLCRVSLHIFFLKWYGEYRTQVVKKRRRKKTISLTDHLSMLVFASLYLKNITHSIEDENLLKRESRLIGLWQKHSYSTNYVSYSRTQHEWNKQHFSNKIKQKKKEEFIIFIVMRFSTAIMLPAKAWAIDFC